MCKAISSGGDLTLSTAVRCKIHSAAVLFCILFNREQMFEKWLHLQCWYDKISTVYQAGLPGGLTLPLSWTVERYRAYEPVQTEVDRTAAQTLLEERLLAQLKEQIGEEGRVVSTYYTARAADSWLEVTLTAECREEIGREVPAAPDAGDSAPEQP